MSQKHYQFFEGIKIRGALFSSRNTFKNKVVPWFVASLKHTITPTDQYDV